LAETKLKRTKKRQLGQFMTPRKQAAAIVASIDFQEKARILEPSFGDGAFLIAIIDRLLGETPTRSHFEFVMENVVYGVELDDTLYRKAIDEIESRWWPLPSGHNLILGDFFATPFALTNFTHIIGNPPFGGSFDPELEDGLDRLYGRWNGIKVKKETYAFFIAKSLELLDSRGLLTFIVSNTFLTISTMAGLRYRLADESTVRVSSLPYFSDETLQPMVVLTALKGVHSPTITIDDTKFDRTVLEQIGKFSWGISPEYVKYFGRSTLGDFLVCTSGMTVGKNELFVREIHNGSIYEPYEFDFYDDPITLEHEMERARLGRLSPKLRARIIEQEHHGETRRNVRLKALEEPRRVELPDDDYRYYNKAIGQSFYCAPTHAIYWKDDGDAVLTFKKNGNWYLHGVGGAKFFGREGITWQLIGSQIRMRYLPEGYILDSGAPCGFLLPGVSNEELWFILAWTNSSIATRIMKNAINHTRNIQSKDIERLPYPWWVSDRRKAEAIALSRHYVQLLMAGNDLPDNWRSVIDDLFIMAAQ